VGGCRKVVENRELSTKPAPRLAWNEKLDRKIGSQNWIDELDVPISELTFRNDVSNFRSNFVIQFFRARLCSEMR
tara:strand:- start:62 stop:286 length:225 start_codon:yes stop_codon:yes gene_type:complete